MAMFWSACGSDQANRSGPPKCHHTARWAGWMYTVWTRIGPQQFLLSEMLACHKVNLAHQMFLAKKIIYNYLKISNAYAVLLTVK